MMMTRFLSAVVSTLLAASFTGFSQAQENDIVTIAVDNKLEVLVEVLTLANLVTTLQSPEANFTVFAPTDEAFAALPEPILNWLLTPDGETALSQILLYHVVDGEVFSMDIVNGTEAPTLEGSNVMFTIGEETVQVNDATVTVADVDASNGVVHVIDEVLIPEDVIFPKDIVDFAADAGTFSTLVGAIQTAGLVDTLKGAGPFTVFAPTDDAFMAAIAGLAPGVSEFLLANPALLTDILTYHVVEGRLLSTDLMDNTTLITVNGADLEVGVSLSEGAGDGNTIEEVTTINDVATVVTFDLMPLNGVIHVIDKLLVPPNFTMPSDIVGTAIKSESFPTLVAALEAADLVDVLAYPGGPYTVFAPTEAAFAKLPLDVLNKLLLPENKATLTQILLGHVVDGEAMSSSLSEDMVIETLQGGNITVTEITENEVTLQGGTVEVVTADIVTINGVIHAIDTVLIPSDITLPQADTCALTENICGTKGDENEYLYCFFDGSKGESKTKCETEEKFLDLNAEDYIVNCGCCANEEDPPEECEAPAVEEEPAAAATEAGTEVVVAEPSLSAATADGATADGKSKKQNKGGSSDDGEEVRRQLRRTSNLRG